MNDLELEIGRTLGASSFFIYQYIKHNPKARPRDIEIETGLSTYCLYEHLKKLRATKVLKASNDSRNNNKNEYTVNEVTEWKLH